MKYEKFEGSLGEFLESYARGDIGYYTLDSGHAYEVVADNLKMLLNIYKQGVYIEKEEVWTDYLPVLCWVWDDPHDIKVLATVTDFTDGWYVEDFGCDYKYAVPVTQAEVDKLIWKGE